MSMQQIMRWEHDFLRIRGGMFSLELLGKSHVSKGNTQKRMPIPSCIHIFIFPHILGSGGTFFIIHPSRFQFFPHGACLVHHLALTKMLWSILIILYSILFMHIVHSSYLKNRVLLWVVRLLLPSSVAQRFGVSFVC